VASFAFTDVSQLPVRKNIAPPLQSVGLFLGATLRSIAMRAGLFHHQHAESRQLGRRCRA
jgi:hypothetical protein